MIDWKFMGGIACMLAAAGLIVWRVRNMTAEERNEFLNQVFKQLLQSALTLVLDAEITYSSGSGPFKKSMVMDELYKRIPEELKKFVTTEQLSAIIETALDQAKKLWAETDVVSILN